MTQKLWVNKVKKKDVLTECSAKQLKWEWQVYPKNDQMLSSLSQKIQNLS